MFTRTGSTWSQQGPKLAAHDETGKGYFGSSVALSSDGDTALVGGPEQQPLGAAWAFTRSGSTWTQQGPKLLPKDGDYIVGFGGSVALSSDGDTAVIGAPDGQPGAWVFRRTGSTWSQQGSRTAPSDAVGVGQFGSNVALSANGGIALVAGPGDNSAIGAVWAFDVNPPQAPSLVSPGAGQTLGASKPTFSWKQSGTGAGIDHYELWIDGSKNVNVPTSSCSGGTCSAISRALTDGSHTWLVKAVDGVGVPISSGTRAFTVDTTPPAPFSLIAPVNGAHGLGRRRPSRGAPRPIRAAWTTISCGSTVRS